ncbi:DUF883 family protein [Oxalicibacterium solurbis]|uniref:DUF883 domain-containing protein n=1 Tax=Oxalicibacterium solurbis TaxID=69280 RepID=A0A8J3AYK0_9BURK|nr:DUF883 family protein [Oxalicibacterium solurbis]GGI54506.1 hypothetical protein GCM10011430_16800 [Oxalicibacterium solurbis]
MMDTKLDDVTKDLKTLSKDAKALSNEAQDDLREKTGELSKKCTEFLNSAMAAAKEVPTIAATRTKEVAASTDEYVHQKPWRAVTLSAGLGILLGVMFAKRDNR